MFGLPVPIDAKWVTGPFITYEETLKTVKFSDEDGWARITFENLDSLRVSRGEYDPYKSDRTLESPLYWVYEVLPSPWLLERYTYEKTHYGDGAYEFSGDVDEMLRDFSHYVFTFDDQFVEALSPGIWFERIASLESNPELSPTHPFRNLERPVKADVFEAYGIVCEVWPNPRPLREILKDAELCSQKLLQFAPVFEGYPHPSWTLAVRVRHGKIKSSLKPVMIGREGATFDGVASLDDAVPYIEQWLKEVAERRKQMGL
jgi:hypothetical protein